MSLVMEKKVIRWKLREIMARKKISVTALASHLDVSRATASRLKNTDEFPPLDHERFNAICLFLGCTPEDLIEYVEDESPKESDTPKDPDPK